MPVETTADLAAFFELSEFGEAALWSSAGAWDPVAVTVVVNRDDQLAAVGTLEVQSILYQARVQVAELPAWAARGDRLVVTDTGEDFEVVKPIERDETRKVALVTLRPVGAA